jgi:hypothetical protein
MFLLVQILLLIQSLFGRGWVFEEKTLQPQPQTHIDVPWIKKGCLGCHAASRSLHIKHCSYNEKCLMSLSLDKSQGSDSALP